MIKNYILQMTEEELETIEHASEFCETCEIELDLETKPGVKYVKYAIQITEEELDKIKYILESCKEELEQRMPVKFREPQLTKTKKLLKELKEVYYD